MKRFLFLLVFGVVFVSTSNAQIQIGQDIVGEAAYNRSGQSVSMPDANTVAIGAIYNNGGSGVNRGHVRVYSWDGNIWTQKGMDIDGMVSQDKSGFSVSMPDASTVAIGAIGNGINGSNSGHVRVFSWNGSSWAQKGMNINGEAAEDQSGFSVSMPDASTVAIGAVGNDGNGSNSGHVRIYSWNGSAWIQKGADIDGEVAGDQSGVSVSMSDSNTVAIGSDFNDSNGTSAGHVRIYEWNGSSWVQKGMNINGEAAGDNSGFSVSMPDASTLAIGAPNNDGNGSNSGHVRIYEWSGSAWIQKGSDIDGEAAGDTSGVSVSMYDTNTVVIGSDYNDGNGNNAGHVRIFSWSGSEWGQKGADIDGEAAGDRLGFSVSMPNPYIIAIGAPYNDLGGTDAGYVRIYKLKGVSGLVFNDLNENCIKENELGINKTKAIIQPGNIIVETRYDGFWQVDSLPAGTYNITIDTTGKWRPTCDVTQSFTVNDPNALTQAPSFGMISTEPCSQPNVSINMPFMRPGFSNQKVYVKACNDYIATSALVNGYVDVSLDELITVNSSSLSYTDMGDNTFRFDVGTLNPGQCVSFDMSTTLSVSAVLGQTMCLEADLYPKESCIYEDNDNTGSICQQPYDDSDLTVAGLCSNDSIFFNVKNIGTGNMQCYSHVRLFIDGELIRLDSVMLTAGQEQLFSFSGDGRTWRLEVDQHPLHPSNSHPNTTIELCGDPSNWTPDLVNILPQDDEDPIKDIYCGIVTGSYDPNDKTGYPLGVGDNHLIEPNRKMEYVIRFQNTGTDTAFTVKILDTLDTDLDIFSVRSGVSSHNYSFRMYGPRVLEWTFYNIKLPDSTTNEPASNGFVTFTVNQVKNLPDGTEINNRVGIYFDYNDPIITNTTSHIIGRPIKTASWTEEQTLNLDDCAKVMYNDIDYTQSGTYWQVNKGTIPNPDTLTTLNITINNTKHSITESVCDSYIAPDGQMYTTSGMKTAIIPNAIGCDSTITIDLTIKEPTTFSLTESVCDTYTAPDGQVYTTSGIKTAIIPNAVSCDSTITIDLTVFYTGDLDLSISQTGNTLTVAEVDATYQWFVCDDTNLPLGNEQSFTPTESGSYYVIVTKNGCTDESSCQSITVLGTIDTSASLSMTKIYPNPNTGSFTVAFGKHLTNANINVKDVLGKTVYNTTTSGEQHNIQLNEAKGIYFVSIQTEQGERTTLKLVVE